ncbi:uncharacterized protein EI90DRAFT_2546247 [Cantharellus anzutake]|uniref:uncharacterized protein n=1 Tax=Cantharellus anzutake TaxID=1750568 RepID=UPI0019058D78|nr:uncharacterized protein EI90DRAFT_2546247 [Cantharellus anzutake]KAF8338143.1 hypothetical protein EI90DRAFT_2546247 [Cantharellus anzutake]
MKEMKYPEEHACCSTDPNLVNWFTLHSAAWRASWWGCMAKSFSPAMPAERRQRRRSPELAVPIDVNPNPLKRKRVEEAPGANRTSEPEYTSKVNFTSIPIEMLNIYTHKYDLVPPIYPSPASAFDPPPPAHLINPPAHLRRSISPSLSIGGVMSANRPRRDPSKAKGDQSRRRSSRLLEEELGWRDRRSPILADIDEAHAAIAAIVQRHYDQQVIRESDAITQFVHAVRVKDRTLKVLPMPPY